MSTLVEHLQEFNKCIAELRALSRKIRVADRGALTNSDLYNKTPVVDITVEDPTFAEGARVYADRRSLLKALADKSMGTLRRIVEIGVLHGDYSRFLLDTVKPDRLDLFDRDFAKLRHDFPSPPVYFHEGNSSALVAVDLPSQSVDMAYVDGDHGYRGVRADVLALIPKLKPRCFVIFNDYSTFNVGALVPYGVTAAAHELINTGEFKIHSICLRGNGLNDLCLVRDGVPGSDYLTST